MKNPANLFTGGVFALVSVPAIAFLGASMLPRPGVEPGTRVKFSQDFEGRAWTVVRRTEPGLYEIAREGDKWVVFAESSEITPLE